MRINIKCRYSNITKEKYLHKSFFHKETYFFKLYDIFGCFEVRIYGIAAQLQSTKYVIRNFFYGGRRSIKNTGVTMKARRVEKKENRKERKLKTANKKDKK